MKYTIILSPNRKLPGRSMLVSLQACSAKAYIMKIRFPFRSVHYTLHKVGCFKLFVHIKAHIRPLYGDPKRTHQNMEINTPQLHQVLGLASTICFLR